MKTIFIRDIERATAYLSADELVAIPTETVYGLAGNALKPETLLNIYKVKQRPSFDPLIIHTSEVSKITGFVTSFPDELQNLAEKFMPGPLTIVLPKKDIIPDIATSGLPTVAVRIPAHPLTLELLQMLEFPLAAPSANLFGKISPTSAEHVFKQLSGRIPCILDGGDCALGIESTIITQMEGQIRVLRLGGLSVEDLQAETSLKVIRERITQDINAPGQIKSHYATRTPLYFDEKSGFGRNKKVAYLRYRDYLPHIPEEDQWLLSPAGSFTEAAKKLFRYMHEMDEADYDYILAEKLPEETLGKAINDRLKRASVNS